MEAASPGDAAVPPRPFLRVPDFGSSSSMPPISRRPRIGNLRIRLNGALPHMSHNRRFATPRVQIISETGTKQTWRDVRLESVMRSKADIGVAGWTVASSCIIYSAPHGVLDNFCRDKTM